MSVNAVRTTVGADGNKIQVGDRVHVDGEWGYEVLRIYRDGKVDVRYLKTDEVLKGIFSTKIRLSDPPDRIKVFRDDKRPSLRVGDYVYHHEIGECVVEYINRRGENWELTVRDSCEKEHASIPINEFDLAGGSAREILYGEGRWHQTSRCLTFLNCPQQEKLIDFLVWWQRTRGLKREFFYCRDKDVVIHGFLSPKSVECLFKRLKEIGFISTETRMAPNGNRRRYIRINYEVIWSVIEPRLRKWRDQYGGRK